MISFSQFSEWFNRIFGKAGPIVAPMISAASVTYVLVVVLIPNRIAFVAPEIREFLFVAGLTFWPLWPAHIYYFSVRRRRGVLRAMENMVGKELNPQYYELAQAFFTLTVITTQLSDAHNRKLLDALEERVMSLIREIPHERSDVKVPAPHGQQEKTRPRRRE